MERLQAGVLQPPVPAIATSRARPGHAEAYQTGADSLPAIGAYFGISRMTVSRAVKRYEAARSSRDVQ